MDIQVSGLVARHRLSIYFQSVVRLTVLIENALLHCNPDRAVVAQSVVFLLKVLLSLCVYQSVFRSSPVLACFLFGLPLGVISLMCYGICTAESDDDSEMKREGLTDEEEEEEEEERRRQALEAADEDEVEEDPEEKSTAQKKLD